MMIPLYLYYIAFGRSRAPMDKYILAKLLAFAGDDFCVKESHGPLAKRLGVAGKTLTKSLEYWIEMGVLVKESPPGGKGRSKPIYWIKPQNLKMHITRQPSFMKCPLSVFIDNLAELDKDSKFGGGTHSLGFGPRELLMVLLAHADNCGVVKDLGYADMVALTGMSRQAVMNQLDRLRREGYIRSSVAGLTGKKLFGKVKSVHFLNLNHRNFGELRRQGLITIYQGFEPGSDLMEGTDKLTRQNL